MHLYIFLAVHQGKQRLVTGLIGQDLEQNEACLWQSVRIWSSTSIANSVFSVHVPAISTF